MKRREICSLIKDLYQKVPIRTDLLSRLETAESPKEAAEIVKEDATVSSEILRIINSPFFGLANKIKSIDHAANLLGAQKLKVLVLTSMLFDFEKDSLPELQALYDHSRKVAALAVEVFQYIREHSSDSEYVSSSDEGSIASAALLHDFGKVPFIMGVAPSGVDESNHDAIAAMLFECFALPIELVQVCRFHHLFDTCATPSIELLCTYIANCISRGESIDAACSLLEAIDVNPKALMEYFSKCK